MVGDFGINAFEKDAGFGRKFLHHYGIIDHSEFWFFTICRNGNSDVLAGNGMLDRTGWYKPEGIITGVGRIEQRDK